MRHEFRGNVKSGALGGAGRQISHSHTDHAHGIGLHNGLCSTHAPSILGICTRSALAAENSSLAPGEIW